MIIRSWQPLKSTLSYLSYSLIGPGPEVGVRQLISENQEGTKFKKRINYNVYLLYIILYYTILYYIILYYIIYMYMYRERARNTYKRVYMPTNITQGHAPAPARDGPTAAVSRCGAGRLRQIETTDNSLRVHVPYDYILGPQSPYIGGTFFPVLVHGPLRTGQAHAPAGPCVLSNAYEG